MHERWQPSAPLSALGVRADLLESIRRYFKRQGVLEVETPVCSRAATTDPAIESFTATDGRGEPRGYLQSSPEFPMKRLLAAGSGSIYQICKAFRESEQGRYHNPEFTLLEWYRTGFDHHQLMDDVVALLKAVTGESLDVEKHTYADLFRRLLDIDPHSATVNQLRQCAALQQIGLSESIDLDRDAWLDLLMSHCIEPTLPAEKLCFVYDYPVSQASLAAIRQGQPPVAERFELYWGGVELANGFHELRDAGEQERRFMADLEIRRERDNRIPTMDTRLIAALEHGLPECAGVALGIDRLLMRLTGADHIDQVLSFPSYLA